MNPTEPRVVELGDAEYPSMLANAPQPPERLWVRGARLDRMPPFVAIVGTRTPTPYGRQIAHDLACDLALGGFAIVSGLARGLDGCAHEGALDANGVTVAVLGTPVDVIHPRVHVPLAERILASGGSIVSEQAPGAVAYRSNFPARNRIIAWMSLGVVVVQGRARSGALQTGRLAADAGRSTFAVPGPIDVACSAGPHQLLRETAKICTGPGDVLAELGTHVPGHTTPARVPTVPQVESLPPEHRAVLGALGRSPRSLDAVAARAGLRVPVLLATMTKLELAGLIAEVNGGGWVRR